MATKIYGCSDDLIEIEGDVREEISAICDDDEHSIIACSDGTLLKVYYDGCWRFSHLIAGSEPFTRIEAEAEDKAGSRPTGEPWYSDVITFAGPITWIAHAKGASYATSKPLVTHKRSK